MSTIAQLKQEQNDDVRKRLYATAYALDQLLLQLDQGAQPTVAELRTDNLVDARALDGLELNLDQVAMLEGWRDELIRLLNRHFGLGVSVDSLRTYLELG